MAPCAGGAGDRERDGFYKKKSHAVKRGRTSLHIARGGLPLADNTVALTVDHVVNIDAGEEARHVRYHILS